MRASRPLLLAICIIPTLLLSGCSERRASSYIPLLTDPDPKVRLDASYALIELEGAAVEPLIAHATGGSDSLLYISSQILGRIGNRRAVPFLRQTAGNANPSVRKEAVVAMGQMGDQSLVPPLANFLAEDPESQIRVAAAESLANLRDTLAVPHLVTALRDTVPLVRQRALASLQYLWTQKAEKAVLNALEDPDETVRFIAAQMLGVHRTSSARDPLCASLLDTSQWVRAEAARALGILGDTTVVENLVHLLEDRDGPDHDAARQALHTLTGMDYVVVEE
ncbi:MAG: HEAT repeat domain-containing protein [Gemmatimonadetes bacterium]|nr:HEAT repeat domain-containing protein [Gemmatimonadota bacterium]